MENQDVFQIFLEQFKDETEMTAKEKRILEVAIELFSEKGYHATSTSEIAKRANVAEGTIFRHFKTKKDILLTLMAPLAIKMASPILLKEVQEILQKEDRELEETLRELLINRLQLLDQNIDRIKIIFQEMQFHPEIQEAVVENLAKKAREMALEFVENQIEKGEIRDLPPKNITRVFASMMFGYIFYRYFLFPDEEKDISFSETAESLLDILLNGVRKK